MLDNKAYEIKPSNFKITLHTKTLMKTANFLTSSCRYCRYYQTEGRRGGMCQQLGVPVQAEWKACALAVRPFTTNWESLEKVVQLENALITQCSVNHTEVPPIEGKNLSPAHLTTV